MCPVIDGQAVNAAVSNAAWLDAQTDDTGVGKITLANADVASGPQVDNLQAEHNSIASFVGKALNAAYNALPAWAASYVGTVSDTVKARVDALTERFSATLGHTHDGVDGNGPRINSINLVTTQVSDSSTGNIDALSTATALSIRLTGASPVTLRGIANGVAAKRVTVMNDTGADVTVTNLSGAVVSTDRIVTGTAADLIVKDQAAVAFEYDGTDGLWRIAGGSGSGSVIVAYQEIPAGIVDGVNDTFALSVVPVNDDSVLVFVDGVQRDAGIEVVVTGTTITFQPGYIPALGQTIYSFYLYEQTGGVAPGVGTNGSPKTEYRTLSAGEIAAKQLTLVQTPIVPSEILVDTASGTINVFSVDFTVSGNVVSWSGLGFDGLLSAGDVLRFHYYY